ncbi:hypothetical protein UT300016_14360 [Clostridium senegalense]
MTPKELAVKIVKDLANRKKKVDDQFYAYQKECNIKKRKK